MSRNGSGTYTVPNTFTSGTRVLVADVNANFSDIATALTGSLALDGQSAMTGQLKGAAGSVSAPGWSWANETGSGWYRAGAGDFRYSVSGTDVVKITSAGLTITGALTATLAANAVVTATITDANVTTAKLADGSVTTAKMADANVTFAKLDSAAFASQAEAQAGSSSTKLMTPQRVSQAITALSGVVSVAVAEVATMSTATALIPFDDTIPQITEGTEVITLSVTTTTSSQRVRLHYEGSIGATAATNVIAALFVGSTADALDAAFMTYTGTSNTNRLTLDKIVSPGAAGTYTYRIRVGPSQTSTLTINGNTSARLFGGVAAQKLIAEVLA